MAMSEMPPLSTKQQSILDMIRSFLGEHGYPPSYRQIGDAVGISSTSVVSYNLKALQKKGYIIQSPDVSRGLRLVEDDAEIQEAAFEARQVVQAASAPTIPMLGVIAAGQPLPIPDSDFSQADCDQITIPPDMVRDTEGIYALQVRGTSMIDDLINDGDIVVLKYQQDAQNGDMIAAWIKDEKATTLKRFYWEENRTRVRLQPANPLMEPIFVHPRDLEIQGRVIGVIRILD